jgi:hypothetical protein
VRNRKREMLQFVHQGVQLRGALLDNFLQILSVVTQPLLCLPQGLLGLFALGDVMATPTIFRCWPGKATSAPREANQRSSPSARTTRNSEDQGSRPSAPCARKSATTRWRSSG